MPLAAPVIFITTGAVIAVRDLMLRVGFQVVIFSMPCLSPKAKSFLAALPWKTDLARGRDIGIVLSDG